MDFFDYLLSFMPHLWLNRKKKGVQRLFGGLAKILEWIDEYRQVVVRNSSTRSAIEILSELESEYGLSVSPTNLSIEARRQRIIAKKRERGGVVQEGDIISLIAAYGLQATLERPENCMLLITVSAAQRPEGAYTNVQEVLENNIRAQVEYDLCYSIEISRTIHVGTFVASKRVCKIEVSF